MFHSNLLKNTFQQLNEPWSWGSIKSTYIETLNQRATNE